MIDVGKPGTYQITFYTFIYCPKEDCNTDDSIVLKVKDENSDFREVFRTGVLNGRSKDKGWINETAYFTAQTPKINVY